MKGASHLGIDEFTFKLKSTKYLYTRFFYISYGQSKKKFYEQVRNGVINVIMRFLQFPNVMIERYIRKRKQAVTNEVSVLDSFTRKLS